jgi:hypothetical protein
MGRVADELGRAHDQGVGRIQPAAIVAEAMIVQEQPALQDHCVVGIGAAAIVARRIADELRLPQGQFTRHEYPAAVPLGGVGDHRYVGQPSVPP